MASSENVYVRRARLTDAQALIAILHDTFGSTWEAHITSVAAQAFRSENRPFAYVGKRGLEFWIAERQGEVIGFVDWQDDFVNALHVRARHSRCGVGTRLMDKAEAEIAKSGFGKVRLETDSFNAKSQAFYRARGYQEADRYPDTEWNSGLTTLLLVKTLG